MNGVANLGFRGLGIGFLILATLGSGIDAIAREKLARAAETPAGRTYKNQLTPLRNPRDAWARR